MSVSITSHKLAKAVRQAVRSSKFFVSGRLSALDPGLEVDGLGAIKLPLPPKTLKALVARCRIAPFGRGTQTLVDTSVRKTFELEPTEVRLNEEWKSAVADAARSAADQLGLPAKRVQASLYKLLVYEKGGFFLPHRDSEKDDGMVASMIVVLANPFEGGALLVRHGPVSQTLRFEDAARRPVSLPSTPTANTRSNASRMASVCAWRTTSC